MNYDHFSEGSKNELKYSSTERVKNGEVVECEALFMIKVCVTMAMAMIIGHDLYACTMEVMVHILDFAFNATSLKC